MDSVIKLIDDRIKTYCQKHEYENGSDETKAELRFAIGALEMLKGDVLTQQKAPEQDVLKQIDERLENICHYVFDTKLDKSRMRRFVRTEVNALADDIKALTQRPAAPTVAGQVDLDQIKRDAQSHFYPAHKYDKHVLVKLDLLIDHLAAKGIIK